MDITGLKMTNDNLGHAVGDELLIIAALPVAGRFLRKTDCVGRNIILPLRYCQIRNLAKAGKNSLNLPVPFDNYNKNHGA